MSKKDAVILTELCNKEVWCVADCWAAHSVPPLSVTWLGQKLWPLWYMIRKRGSWFLLFKTYKSCRAGRPWKASPGTVCMALWQRRRSCSNDSPLNGFPSRLSIWLLARSLEPRIRWI